ncbi:MAG: DNA gyrase inhibitor YacG [Pseudomonadota bacterium]
MPSDPASTTRFCPLCRKPSVAEYRPFCSRGCRDRDLNAWFDEGYRIAVTQAADEGDEPPLPDAAEE